MMTVIIHVTGDGWGRVGLSADNRPVPSPRADKKNAWNFDCAGNGIPRIWGSGFQPQVHQ